MSGNGFGFVSAGGQRRPQGGGKQDVYQHAPFTPGKGGGRGQAQQRPTSGPVPPRRPMGAGFVDPSGGGPRMGGGGRPTEGVYPPQRGGPGGGVGGGPRMGGGGPPPEGGYYPQQGPPAGSGYYPQQQQQQQGGPLPGGNPGSSAPPSGPGYYPPQAGGRPGPGAYPGHPGSGGFQRPPMQQQQQRPRPASAPAPPPKMVAEPFDLADFIDAPADDDLGGVEESKDYEPASPAGVPAAAPAAVPPQRNAFIATGVTVGGSVQTAEPLMSEQLNSLRHDIAVLKAQLAQQEERTQARLKAVAAASASAPASVMESAELQQALKSAIDQTCVFYGYLAGGRAKEYNLYGELPFDEKTGAEKAFVRPKYRKKGGNWLCLSYPRKVQQVMLTDAATGAVNGTTIHLWYTVRVVNKSGDFERLWVCDKTMGADGELANSFEKFQMYVDGGSTAAAVAAAAAAAAAPSAT